LLLSVVSQLHSLHSCCYELKDFKTHTTSNNTNYFR
jgi:hypothetical protein